MTVPATAAGHGSTVLPLTRALAVVIVPFLLAAFGILFLFPGETGRLFAWPLQPPVTAMWLGAVYLGGAWFFTHVVVARSWRQVALGFPPVAAFATMMGVATVLHWDRFTPGHVAFTAWAVLYFATPVLVLAAWWHNTRVAGSHAPSSAARLGRTARTLAAVVGVASVVVSLWLFLVPSQAMAVWPWALTPLSARVVAATVVLGGAGVLVALDGRGDAVRLLVQVEVVMLTLGLVALVVARRDVDWTNPLAWAIAAVLITLLAAAAALHRSSSAIDDR